MIQSDARSTKFPLSLTLLHPACSCTVAKQSVSWFGQQTIVDCVAEGGRRWARPVDCCEAPDGTILFTSDDPQSGIFRISRAKDSSAQR